MPLDPTVVEFMKYAASLNPPDPRRFLTESRKAGHADKAISGSIDTSVVIEHRFITTPTADVPIRIYRPNADAELRSCLIYFHGGGWMSQNIDRYDALLSQISKRTNAVVVSVNYQKAPEHRFPVPFDDCYATLEWVVENEEFLNIDGTRIGVMGASSGGNLAAAVAIKARDVGLVKLAYQILLYPCLNLDFHTKSFLDYAEGYGLTRENMIWAWKQYIDFDVDGSNPYAVPASAKSLKDVAPAIIVTAEYDPLTDDSRNYIKMLEESGVKYSYLHLEGMIHGTLNQGMFVPQAEELLDYLISAIIEKTNAQK